MPIKIKIETPLYTDSKKINLFEKISGWVASTNKITRIDLLTSTTSEPLILTPRAELKEKGSLQAFKNSKFFESPTLTPPKKNLGKNHFSRSYRHICKNHIMCFNVFFHTVLMFF